MQEGEYLRSLRLEAGLSQEQLARRVGLKSANSIHNIEMGRTPIPWERWPKFAVALGVSLDRWLNDMRVSNPQRTSALERLFEVWLRFLLPNTLGGAGIKPTQLYQVTAMLETHTTRPHLERPPQALYPATPG